MRSQYSVSWSRNSPPFVELYYVYYRGYMSQQLVHILSHINSFHALITTFFKIHFKLCTQVVPYLPAFQQKSRMHFTFCGQNAKLLNAKRYDKITLTPWGRVLLEKLIVTKPIKFPALYGTRRFINMFTRAHH
jgi:hypothetical protein